MTTLTISVEMDYAGAQVFATTTYCCRHAHHTRARRESVAFAASSSASKSAAAPSLTPDALPAVTVPSGRTTPLSFASASRLVSRGCSSWRRRSVALLLRIVTGTISASKQPAFCAARRFCWLRSANASWSARLDLVVGRRRSRPSRASNRRRTSPSSAD